MRAWIYVHPQAEYDKWAAENLKAEASAAASEAKPAEAAKPAGGEAKPEASKTEEKAKR